ncbi:ATP-dependent RNA helicase ddx18 [Chrysochromulina tobinii]|uniref:ATP-dependent RNA helicase n=1 Tax=Chrysochromulina tobinii TaxID=1460289 RepID=A0A0M0JI80_9EUKA|nr:ATP-dependent RNA helicase ddx18 [Chrysochromulina tobinii]|eukprot:KOO26316.1 ATP-dependent RNA helicase ddx18 [Chrysochromulina sp. CCMP291]
MQMARLTPVQQHSIPALLGGGDLLVRSPTGSGKTLAYAVPIVQSLVSRGATIVTRAAGTFAIVLVPTRELCLQTHDVSYAFVPTRQRLTALLALLHSKCVPAQQPGGRACKMIVFVSSCDGVDFLYELLAAAGRWPDLREAAIKAGHANEHDELNGGNGIYYGRSNADDTVVVRLHGKMKQKDRTQAFHRFRDLSSGVMICTDVAARGLNLQGVHWIVQHDLPQDAKEYLHRAGRTARLGQGGQAVLLLHPCEAAFLQLLRQAGVHPRELQFASLQAALCPEGSRRDVFVLEVALQKQLEEAVKERAFLEHAAIGAYQSYLLSV